MTHGKRRKRGRRAKSKASFAGKGLGRTGHQSVSSKVCNKEKTQGKKNIEERITISLVTYGTFHHFPKLH